MSDALSVEQRIARGQRAAQLLNDEVLIEARAAARDRILAEWQETTDPQQQQAAWAKVRALGEVDAELRRMQADGEFAAEGLRRAT